MRGLHEAGYSARGHGQPRQGLAAALLVLTLLLPFVFLIPSASAGADDFWVTLLTNPILIKGSSAERSIGDQFHATLLSSGEGPAVPTPPNTQAVFDRLVAVIQRERSNIPYTLTVLDSESLDAFATAGGYVYITTGLLSLLDDDQTAGVLGHELAHTVRSHIIDQWSLAVSLGQLSHLVADRTQVDVAIPLTISFLLSRGYSRSQEIEADLLGQRWAAEAGFRPSGLAEALTIIEGQADRHPSALELYLSTHPLTEERIDKLAENTERLAADYPSTGPSSPGTDTGRWALLSFLLLLLLQILK